MISGIIEILSENVTVQTLVGKNKANGKYKVYPVRAPQKEDMPYITVFRTGQGALPSLSKELVSGLDYPSVTVVCWHKNYRPAEILGDACRIALDNVTSDTDAGYNFDRIWCVDIKDTFDDAAELYGVVVTFQCELLR